MGSCELPAQAHARRAQTGNKAAFLRKAPPGMLLGRHSYKWDPESKADITGKRLEPRGVQMGL